ncbi:MAG: helix-turn-helix transcriptional regulator [Solidesulfovibrio sp.]
MTLANKSSKAATVGKSCVALPLSTPHLMRERQVLQFYPVSRAELWNRVRDGRFPKPVKLSPKISAWRSGDILRVLQDCGCVEGAA